MNILRLHEVIAEVCPIDGVSITAPGDPPTVLVAYSEVATEQERADAQAVVSSFDWSSEAEAAWKIARVRQQAAAQLLQAAGANELGVRANAHATWFERNNVAEALWAALELVCVAANIPIPTVSQITDRIAANRAALGQTFTFPSAQDAAERGTRRLMENDILQLVQTILQTGGADSQSE